MQTTGEEVGLWSGQVRDFILPEENAEYAEIDTGWVGVLMVRN